ncbi:hypothetical protein NPIL_517411 [Nephila pilipes]|uniref:Uncharacterized protein n=1 Tax=Nephila pilipes TaxID=299642 RepID=A0A8X6PWS4_NEPPI|nr:hypothetical protein NPIL_517411 [Nephila pilipes]
MAAHGISPFDLRRQPMKFVCFGSGAYASLTGANGLIRRLRLPSHQLQKVEKPVDLKVSARLGHHTNVQFFKIEKSGKIVVLELTSGEEAIKVSSSETCGNQIEDIDSTIEKKEEDEVPEESNVWKIVGITLCVVLGICAIIAVVVILFIPSSGWQPLFPSQCFRWLLRLNFPSSLMARVTGPNELPGLFCRTHQGAPGSGNALTV